MKINKIEPRDNSPPKQKTIFYKPINLKHMKTIKLLFATTLLYALSTNAQITKGNWMVGGSGNISSYENKYINNGTEISNKGLGINISPNIGYFFANKFVAGANISIGYTKPQGYENSTSYGIGPFVRYYFLKEDKRINLLAQANYSFGSSKSGINRSQSNGYGFKAGPAIFFNSSVALEVTLDYNSSKLIPNNSQSSSYNNFQVGLGFQIHLEK